MQPPRRKDGQGAAVWKFAQKTLLLHEVLQLVEYNRPNIAENDISKGLSRSRSVRRLDHIALSRDVSVSALL